MQIVFDWYTLCSKCFSHFYNTDSKIDDVDIVEMTEAFAAQSIPVKDNLHIPDEKIPSPPPIHAVAIPVRLFSCSSAFTKVVTNLAPLAPIGCPSAIAHKGE
jgi:hypothetical protein